MAIPKLTIPLSHYHRHVPFFDGTVQAEGFDLDVLMVGQSDRQRRVNDGFRGASPEPGGRSQPILPA